jgi:hypothetical protein
LNSLTLNSVFLSLLSFPLLFSLVDFKVTSIFDFSSWIRYVLTLDSIAERQILKLKSTIVSNTVLDVVGISLFSQINFKELLIILRVEYVLQRTWELDHKLTSSFV